MSGAGLPGEQGAAGRGNPGNRHGPPRAPATQHPSPHPGPAGEPRLAVGVAAEVKSKLTVLDVVGETVALKKAGTTYKGLCPFHGEKTPSFIVTPGRESWHCFGCGEGGDVFSFVMRRDGLTFPEALKILASRAGVEIDERTSREDARRRHLHDVLESAISFYHAVLTKSPTGERALAYLRERGFTDETIEWANLGWAPPDWDALGRTLEKRRQIGTGRTGRGGPGHAAQGRPRRLRPVPRPGRLPDPRRHGQRHGPGRPRPEGRRRRRSRGPEVPQLAGHPAVRQEPHALPARPGEGPDPQDRHRGHRRGLHRRPDGPPGRLHERRGEPGDGADARPGRPPHPLRGEEDRPRLRRRPGRREGRHPGRDVARGAHPAAGRRRHRRRARRGARRPAPGGQGSGRDDPREPRRLARGDPDRPADRGVPDRVPCPRCRPAHDRWTGPLHRRDPPHAPDRPQPGAARRLPPDAPPGLRGGGAGAARGAPPRAGRRPGRPGARRRRGSRAAFATAGGSRPIRSCPRPTPSTRRPSCARSRRSSASSSASSSSPPSSRASSSSACRPRICPRPPPASSGRPCWPCARRARTRRRPSTPAWTPRRRPSWPRSSAARASRPRPARRARA